MKISGIIRIILALIIISVIIYVLYLNDYFIVVKKISFFDLLILTSLTLISYVVSGFQMFYLIKKQNKVKLSFADTVLLPLSMSLFSYIIPTNGGLLFSVYFLKKKYKLDTSKGFAIGVFSIYISLIITGFFGFISCIYTSDYNLWVILISFVFVFFSIIINLINRLLMRFELSEKSWLHKINLYLNSIVVNSNDFMRNKKTVFVISLINISFILVSYISYEYLNYIFDIGLTMISIFTIILITRISSLIRLLPGNLGLEELYNAAIFEIIGNAPGLGVIFSLLLRITTIVLFIPLGILHTFYNFKILRLNVSTSIFSLK